MVNDVLTAYAARDAAAATQAIARFCARDRAAVRQAAVLLRVVQSTTDVAVAANYWRGAWTGSGVFLGPTRCIADHP